MDLNSDILLEASWEVCNKVGGIYTVIQSKTAQIANYYKHFYLIGPYFINNLSGQFIERTPNDDIKNVIEKLKNEGIIVHYGEWLIDSHPNVFLIDFQGSFGKLNELKKNLWEHYGIDSLNSGYDFEEPVVWSYCVGRLMQELTQGPFSDKKVVSQFHEWLSGNALLYLKQEKVKIGTVFTTHATMLGRTLAGNGHNLYEDLENIDPQKEAYNFNIQDKFLMEQQCAKYADVFTTVSEITGIEAEYFLGRKPDVLLPNGLDIDKFPSFEDGSIKHRDFREQIRDYVMAHFFPYYTFDIENTLYFFICARYEYRTKGMDIFIKALQRANEEMKKQNTEKSIVAFFFVPGDIKNIKAEVVEAKSYFDDIKDLLDSNEKEFKRRLLYSFASKQDISKDAIFKKDFLDEMKRRSLRFKKEGLPPICTHDLNNENVDEITKGLREAGLDNKEEDKVKVIQYPIYLNGVDNLLNTDYYETMTGCHFGVFPSYYEPWGYTPLEAGALGIPAVTTDLSGFGMYVKQEVMGKEKPGIYVLERLHKNDEEVIDNMAQLFLKYVSLRQHDRVDNKINARKIASKADWKNLILEYIKAHNLAIEKIQ